MTPLCFWLRIGHFCRMALVLTFLMVIANFALNRAVLASRHPLVAETPFRTRRGRGVALLFEFLVLVTAMLLANQGAIWGAWAYAFYTAANGVAAWMIFARRP